jgi:flagellar biosynthesis protein FlhF
MNLKTYQAKTMAEALAMVRKDLGNDAVILNTRTLRKGGLFGVGARQVIEITASKDTSLLNSRKRSGTIPAKPKSTPGTTDTSTAKQDGTVIAAQRVSLAESQMQKELQLVKQMVAELVRENRRTQHPSVPEELYTTYTALLNQEVAEEVADGILRQVRAELRQDQWANPDLVRRAVLKCVEKMIPAAGPVQPGVAGRPRVIAFVGPTGVGKTTTIAKLAANFKLREGRSVGLITIDTYRIAAVDQLKTYANIIGIPLQVVLTPQELCDAIQAMRGCDVILVDTAGRSHTDKIKLQELKNFLDLAKVDETHLVLSSTSSQTCIEKVIEQFSAVGVEKVVFTKLDEAVGVGMLLNVMKSLNRSISYITTGQNVPDDIEPGCGRQLARMLLQQCQAELAGERLPVAMESAGMQACK